VKIFKEVLAQYPEYNDQKLEYFVRHTFEEVDQENQISLNKNQHNM
jgi:flagellar biosynthesis/type III secretory pathway protein FliH